MLVLFSEESFDGSGYFFGPWFTSQSCTDLIFALLVSPLFTNRAWDGYLALVHQATSLRLFEGISRVTP